MKIGCIERASLQNKDYVRNASLHVYSFPILCRKGCCLYVFSFSIKVALIMVLKRN